MGTYLSTPVTDKCEEQGNDLDCGVSPVAWGAVDMQGWRKSMEDAHVACSGVPYKANLPAKVFGVFDGHGGPEVARFCQLYLVSVLTQQESWMKHIASSSGAADVSSAQKKLQLEDSPTSTTTGTTVTNESAPESTANATDEFDPQANPAQSDIGLALRSAFHAMDRLIDSQSKRDELMRLRAVKPPMGEQREAQNIPPAQPIRTLQTQEDASPQDEEDVPFDEMPKETNSTTHSESSEETTDSSANIQFIEVETEKKDDDSDAPQGMQEACEIDRDMMEEDSNPKSNIEEEDDSGNDGDDEGDASTAGKVSVMFQRLLHMSPTSKEQQTPPSAHAWRNETSFNDHIPLEEQGPPTLHVATAPASMTQAGRLMCNLPDHAIHAGATAVVAVLVGNVLTVANAGDSRGVLCRNGVAFPLSFDHKPSATTEMERIQKAGGFVNHFGRVNGNLNLSRSIGDLKYKQVAGIAAAQQMITSEPDILQVQLQLANAKDVEGSDNKDVDEFFLLGCDGIWDCLTNQQAVDFVRERINDKHPCEIGKEMLDSIVSVDPRTTQGIGGDNMTIMIVDLNPHRKAYYKNQEANPADDEVDFEMDQDSVSSPDNS